MYDKLLTKRFWFRKQVLITCPLSGQVTYRRIKSGLNELEKLINGPAAHTVSVLFGESPPRSTAPSLPPQLTGAEGKIQLFNSKLLFKYHYM